MNNPRNFIQSIDFLVLQRNLPLKIQCWYKEDWWIYFLRICYVSLWWLYINVWRTSRKDKSLTVHHYDIQTLSIELFKVHNNLSQTIFSDLLVRNHLNYNLSSQSGIVIPQVKTVYKGSNSLWYFAPIIRNLIPNELNIAIDLMIFYVKHGSGNPALVPVYYAKTLSQRLICINNLMIIFSETLSIQFCSDFLDQKANDSQNQTKKNIGSSRSLRCKESCFKHWIEQIPMAFWSMQQVVPNFSNSNPAGIYLLKVNNRNTRTRCEIC